MKKIITPGTLTALVAAGLVSSGAGVQAQYTTPNSAGRSTDSTASQTTQGQRSTNSMASASSGQVMKINKASSLIGSTVKNQQGEKLGKINDVVIDFNSDQVSYVVLATDSGLLQAEKLHAVPLRAFQTSADGTSLTLNADKDKLARSEGFDRNTWPGLNSSTWGAEPFWKDSSGSQDATQPGSQGSSQQNGLNGTSTTPGSSTYPSGTGTSGSGSINSGSGSSGSSGSTGSGSTGSGRSGSGTGTGTGTGSGSGSGTGTGSGSGAGSSGAGAGGK